MASGGAVMNEWIRSFRRLPREIRAEKFRDAMDEELRRTIRAGTTPEGEPWPEKKGGGRALQDADAALTVVAAGQRVIARVSGPEAVHHRGTKKDPQRKQIPTAMTPSLREKLKARFKEICRSILGGR